MTKTLILDTNVYLTEVSSLFAFGKNNIAIPTIVLDEIDKHKQRQDTAGFNARTMNRTLDGLRRKGSLFDGVSLGRGKGKVFAAQYDPRYMPAGMDTSDSDNKIIAIALRLKLEGNEVAVISRDLNMRVKCDAFGLECHDYQPQQVIKSVEKLSISRQMVFYCQTKVKCFFRTNILFLLVKMTLRSQQSVDLSITKYL